MSKPPFPARQHSPRPQAEGAGFGKSARHHRPHLGQVDPVTDLPGPGQAEGVGFPVKVEAGDLYQPDAAALGVLVAVAVALATVAGVAGAVAMGTTAGVGGGEAVDIVGVDLASAVVNHGPGLAG